MDLEIPNCDPQLQDFLRSLQNDMKNFAGLVTANKQLSSENESLRAELRELKLSVENQKNVIISTTRRPTGPTTPVLSSAQISSSQPPLGTAASKHAPTNTASSQPAPVKPLVADWSTIAKRGVPRKSKAPLSERKRLATARPFTAPESSDAPSGYEYVYIHRKRNITRKDIRHRFALLGVSTARVIDINFPAQSVVGILIHKEFKPAFKTILDECKIPTIDDFNPCAADNIADPQYINEEPDMKIKIGHFIHSKRCEHTFGFIREYLVPSVSKFFVEKGWIQDKVAEAIVKRRMPRPLKKRALFDDAALQAFIANIPDIYATTNHDMDITEEFHENAHGTDSDEDIEDAEALPSGLWNANNSLQATTISEVLSHCQSFTILFITETWILPPSLLKVGWTEFHTYGKPVFDRNNRRSRGSQGIVALINPSCPLPVSHLISSNPYILSLQLGQLRISCFYLPPSLSLSQASAALDSIPLDRNTILCGDFNARLSSLTGDTDSNPRGTQFKSWFEDRDLEVLNATLAYGIPTFTRMMNEVEHTSIIDLFITNNLTILQRPAIEVYSDLTMGSDHCLLALTFDLELDNNAPIDPTALPPRRTWKLSKLGDPKVCAEYARVFTEKSKDLLDSVTLIQQDLVDYPGSSVPPDFDDINDKLCSAIYSSLDSSAGNKPKKAAHHAKYWTEELQATADFRNTCYKQWRRSSGIDKLVTWTKYIAANAKFRYQILVAKRLSWRDYCRSLEVDFNKAVSQIKFGKRRREQSGTFSHVDGPGTAAKVMADHLEKVYDGQYLPASHSVIDFISSELPFVDSFTRTNDDTSNSANTTTAIDSSTSAAIFAQSNIESYIGCLPRRKAPGIDHLRAEMLVPITAPTKANISWFQ